MQEKYKVTISVEKPDGAQTYILESTSAPIVETMHAQSGPLSETPGDIHKVRFEIQPNIRNDVGTFVKVLRGMPEARDEYHTMEELYHYRMLYHACAIESWEDACYRTVKSKRHSDGELCFDGEYFIVVTDLPSGQISNHYKLEWWSLFQVEEVEKAPFWDGHTPEVASRRIEEYLRSILTVDPEDRVVPNYRVNEDGSIDPLNPPIDITTN